MQRGIADSVIVKSNYFALSLYKELAARLPEHGVLLSPHAVKLDANGRLTSEPITQAESIPNVVSIDFATYSFPDPKKMMGSEPLTFGDLVTPLITVRTDHRAAAATQGVLLASDSLLETAAGAGRDSVKNSLQVMQRGQFDTAPSELAQRKYLSVQSLRIFDGIHNGEMGVQMRDMILAEYNVLEKRRKLARQQNTAAALSVFAVVAAGEASYNLFTTQNSAHWTLLQRAAPSMMPMGRQGPGWGSAMAAAQTVQA